MQGSSPRARGTLAPSLRALLPNRFIPAGAGNTSCCCSRSRGRPVHPRGRGEHSPRNMWASLITGSSPRARGTRLGWRTAPQRRRFIPAGAGNTAPHLRAGVEQLVHPRGRGEHAAPLLPSVTWYGSSPRARGTRRCGAWPSVGLRFIPAGAGNTRQPAGPKGQQPVHPRGRGEHPRPECMNKLPHGSSPRARGTLTGGSSVCGVGRFIPAGAGNTYRTTTAIWPLSVHPRGRGEHIRTIGDG